MKTAVDGDLQPVIRPTKELDLRIRIGSKMLPVSTVQATTAGMLDAAKRTVQATVDLMFGASTTMFWRSR